MHQDISQRKREPPMIPPDIMRALRNDLPMKLTVTRLGQYGPISKHSDGCFRFQCPYCSELRATVNPKNNLAHCISCGENINNIDLMLLCGHDFLGTVAYSCPVESIRPIASNRKRGGGSTHRPHRKDQNQRLVMQRRAHGEAGQAGAI